MIWFDLDLNLNCCYAFSLAHHQSSQQKFVAVQCIANTGKIEIRNLEPNYTVIIHEFHMFLPTIFGELIVGACVCEGNSGEL